MTERKSLFETLPVLPLRGLMVFPYMVLHFDVGRPKSIAALEKCMAQDQRILLVSQKNADVDDPKAEDLCHVGTIAIIKQVLNLPGENIRVLAEGIQRAVVMRVEDSDKYMTATVRPVKPDAKKDDAEMAALASTTKKLFEEYCSVSLRVPPETLQSVSEIEEPAQLADVIASNVLNKLEDRQDILEKLKTKDRLEALCVILLRETEMAETEKSIQSRIKAQVDKNQKEYYLHEQIKAIQAELGEKEENQVEELRLRLANTPLNDEAREKASKELDRISHMAPGTPEINISRTYVEWILDMPWGKTTEDRLDLKTARKVLEEDHYGLEKVKDRIIEYLAVLSIKKDMRGPILCFVGPPGVGKTSIVRSIARAVGRKFVQMSLGGVRDEAEIRGHRRTYIGAIPGRIISGIKQAGTMNPVFLFDEIDKLGSDHRGDPASAMLEVLDAEQNNAFRDHYMELPFDLSRVMFITTANNAETIPPALLDRMEIIEVPSYTEEEKLKIAKKHLLPKQVEAHGLAKNSVRISDKVLTRIIEDYTREAGVRTLERTIGSVVRKTAVEMLDQGVSSVTVSIDKLRSYLGGARFLREGIEKENLIGTVNGLAYTTVGGEMLTVECGIMKGNGTLQLTGKLGDVMQESAKAALTWVRSNCNAWGIAPEFFKEHDIHIHVPEGAVPKDGPSAGVTLSTALTSAITMIPVRRDVAMTGEITLRGRVLPIGGLKEKLMAAYRAQVKTVLIPRENVKDLEDVPAVVKEKVSVIPVDTLAEVITNALVCLPGNTEEKVDKKTAIPNISSPKAKTGAYKGV